jgi:ribosomal protein L44E
MMLIEKIGVPKDIWVMCPKCRGVYYVERLFWEPQYNDVKLYCPFCHTEFAKQESPRIWGM